MTTAPNLHDLSERLGVDPNAVAREKVALERERTSFHLRALRKAAGLTQTQLAAVLGVSQNRISRLERGEASSVQMATLERYVSALGGELRVSMRVGDVDYPIAVTSSPSSVVNRETRDLPMAVLGS